MALPDFTGQNIEDTYQRVLQTDEGRLRDGTGSLVTLTALTVDSLILNHNSIGSTLDGDVYLTMGTNGFSFEANAGDKFSYNSYQNNVDLQYASENDQNVFYIDASTDRIGVGTNSPSHKLSVIGHISASRLIAGQVDGFIKDGNGGPPDNNGILTYNSASKRFTSDEGLTFNGQLLNARTEEITLESLSEGIKLSGSISLTGNVTASGVIKASAFVNTSDTSLGLNLRGAGTEITGALDVTQNITATNITASSNISASGTITAASFVGTIDGGSF